MAKPDIDKQELSKALSKKHEVALHDKDWTLIWNAARAMYDLLDEPFQGVVGVSQGDEG